MNNLEKEKEFIFKLKITFTNKTTVNVLYMVDKNDGLQVLKELDTLQPLDTLVVMKDKVFNPIRINMYNVNSIELI